MDAFTCLPFCPSSTPASSSCFSVPLMILRFVECERAEKAVKMMEMQSCLQTLQTSSLNHSAFLIRDDVKYMTTEVWYQNQSSVYKERHEHMYMVSVNSEEFICLNGEHEITTDVSLHMQQHTHVCTRLHCVICCSLPSVSPSTL